MALTGIGSTIQAAALAQKDMESKLDVLSRQLGTGQKAALYSELGSQAGLSVGLDRQLSAIAGFDATNSTITATLGIEKASLSQIGDIANSVQGSAEQPAAFTLSNTGQTALQANAAGQLDELLGVFNTQVGDNYVFSGSALNQPSVDTTDHILNGNGAQAGLKQVISERGQADLGASGLGRLVIPAAAGSTVSINEDVAGSPFGFKLGSVGSTLTGATVTQPAFTTLLANIGALAATSYAAVNVTTTASYAALTSRVSSNLGLQQGAQNISDIDADIANAQVTATNAQSVNTQTKSTLTDMLQSVEGVSTDQIGVQILTLQNSLQASLSTTARLATLTLTSFLAPA